jgi:hypothetical protein
MLNRSGWIRIAVTCIGAIVATVAVQASSDSTHDPQQGKSFDVSYAADSGGEECGQCTTFRYVATSNEHPPFTTHRFGAGGVASTGSDRGMRDDKRAWPSRTIVPVRPIAYGSWTDPSFVTEGECDVAPWQRCYSVEAGAFRCDSEGCHANYAPGWCSSLHSSCTSGGGESEELLLQALAVVRSDSEAQKLARRLIAEVAFELHGRDLALLGCDGSPRALVSLSAIAHRALDEVLVAGDAVVSERSRT